MRTDDSPKSAGGGRHVGWLAVVGALILGVALALKYGPQITPLIDSLH